MTKTISAAEFLGKLETGEACCVVDVRSAAEYSKSRLKAPTVNIPLDSLDAAGLRAANGDSGRPVYLVCASGARAGYAVEKLEKDGVGNLVVVEDGLNACKTLNAGLVERGK